jgi:SAM-dependent methyltransferase
MFFNYDPEALRRQYGSDRYLRLRQETHEHYSVPRIDFPGWVLGHLVWRGDERLLDVGAGHGIYYERIRDHLPGVHYFGLDTSPGMLQNHQANGNLLLADAQRLPYPAATFDVVMANHMLYHVPDVEHAISEFRRVLKPGGVVVTATNSVQSMPEFNTLFRRAIMLLSEPGNIYTQPPMPVHNAFALENGARLLARQFFAVVRYDLPQALVFDSVEPALAYIESWRPLREPQLPDEVLWDDVMLVIREQIDRVIAHFGELAVSKLSGVLVAADSGGFIQQFRELQQGTNGQAAV